MLDYKTETRVTRAEPMSPEELLEERRAYFYGLVDRIFDPKDPQGRDIPRTELAGLTLYEMLGMYAAMRTSREIDTMMGLLQRTGKLWFSIAGAGKEAMNVAMAAHMRPDDAKLPYYRDQALALSGLLNREIDRPRRIPQQR